MKNLIILIYYFNIDGMSRAQAGQFIYEFIETNKISEEIQNATNTEILQQYIPVRNQETRVECIYPTKEQDIEYIKDHIFNANEQINKLFTNTCDCGDNCGCKNK